MQSSESVTLQRRKEERQSVIFRRVVLASYSVSTVPFIYIYRKAAHAEVPCWLSNHVWSFLRARARCEI